jgi:hypothetical protein
MSDTDDQKLKAFAGAIRSGADTPQAKAFVEDVIARIERSDAYYTALGKFVSDFSRVETTLHTSLWAIAGVRAPVAQAIFSGFKIEGCLQLIKRIADAKNWPATSKQRLENITSHLGPINKLRNDILHYGVTPDLGAADAWLLSNKGFVHIPEKIRETSITPALLKAATSDLTKLFGLVIALTFYVLMPDDELQKQLEDSPLKLKSAWLYKPPQQAKKSGKSQKTRRKQPRRHRASREKP